MGEIVGPRNGKGGKHAENFQSTSFTSTRVRMNPILRLNSIPKIGEIKDLTIEVFLIILLEIRLNLSLKMIGIARCRVEKSSIR